jgi:hypothetical protein
VNRTEWTVNVAPGRAATVPLLVRNWTRQPRAWKIETAQDWLKPEKTEGSASGFERVSIRVDASGLPPEKRSSGELTVVDTTTGRRHTVRIHADVGRAYQLPGERLVMNAPPDKDHTTSVLISNFSGKPARFSAAAAASWLAAEPSSAELAPGQRLAVKLTGKPGTGDHLPKQTKMSFDVDGTA